MDSASFRFILFGLVIALLSNVSRNKRWRSGVLMIASLVFVFMLAGSWVPLVPLASFLVLGYAGLLLVRRGSSRLLPCMLVVVIVAYVWLKKYTFLPANTFLEFPYFTLGLSYIFFRVLHLMIECASFGEEMAVGPFEYSLYTLNFTTFLSGPIQRYDEFAADQFADKPIGLTWNDVGLQGERLIRGFFKVNVLGMILKAIQQDCLAELSQPLGNTALFYDAFRLAVVYPFFLYCNFSGYIDIVIALARLMRVRLPENFDRPFSASSFLDFWNRWHITLSTWLKTYVYNPLLLALMRRIRSVSAEPLLGVFSFFVTFFLVGVWHGRTSEFIVFGLLQGGGVAINKLWQIFLARALGRKEYKALAKDPIYKAFGRGLTFSWFAFTLFWFWAGWPELDRIWSAISPMQWAGVWVAVWLAATVVLTLWEWLRASALSIGSQREPVLLNRYSRVAFATTLAVIAAIIIAVTNEPAPGIVYKAF